MLKSRPKFFTKTIKNHKNQTHQTSEAKSTHRNLFKQTNNHSNMNRIIKDLQRSVKELRNYQQSAHKVKNRKFLKKSSSEHQLLKNNECGLRQLRIKNKQNSSHLYKASITRNSITSNVNNQISKKQGVLSMLSKHPLQNMSTMFTLSNSCDVDEVKKAYQHAYGKENTNIVDLYNFFKKNVQKSTRIQRSIDISNCPHNQVSEQIHKSKFQSGAIKKKQNDLNVIIEDRNEKDNPLLTDRLQTQPLEVNLPMIFKKSTLLKPSIEQIFKNGSPDLANVFDFIKKKRFSLKNYVRLENQKNKQNNGLFGNKKLDRMKESKQDFCKGLDPQRNLSDNHSNFNSQPDNQRKSKNQNQFCDQINNRGQKLLRQQPFFSSSKKGSPIKKGRKEKDIQMNYYQQKSSHKSSLKTSKKKQINFMNENISAEDLGEFLKTGENQKMFNFNNNDYLNQNEDFIVSKICQIEQADVKESIKIDNKFRKSKYYVQPIPAKLCKKQSDSLEGCQISLRSSSRIIQLDFLPLDL